MPSRGQGSARKGPAKKAAGRKGGSSRGGSGRKASGRAESAPSDERVWALAEVAEWFTARVDDGWFEAAPEVAADREEIQVIGILAAPSGEFVTAIDRETAAAAAIQEFRESTREARVEIAQVAEATWARKVSWGVRCGEREELFTHASVPVMTRLRLADRRVLDTLVAANVARSRSDALGWCVRQIAERDDEWLDRLREALAEVDRVRTGVAGPDGSTSPGSPQDAPPDSGS